MTRARQHGAAAGLALLLACGGGSSRPDNPLSGGSLNGNGVVLTTEHTSYGQGDPVQVTIQSLEGAALAYNACTRQLQVLRAGAWVPGPESLRLCSREVSYVPAGATIRDTAGLDIGLSPGEYRLVITFAADGAPEGEVIPGVTNSFTITP
jgi:hypothetical protein